MRKSKLYKILPAMLGILLLTSCNLPTRLIEKTPVNDPVATQVSMLLTQAATATVKAAVTQAAPASATPTTALPTNTPEPTFTTVVLPTQPKATATPIEGDPKNALGTPTWMSKLEDSKSFYLYENDNTKVTWENKSLILTGLNSNGWMGWSLTFSHPAVNNFYIEAQLDPQQCSGADMYGLVFRAPSTDAGYFFGVTCDGKYNLHARDFAANSDVSLIQQTANSAIHSGSNQINRLGVMTNGDKIQLYANGVLLDEVNDATFKVNKGYFGAFVAANATAGFTVKMHEISLWNLP